MTPRRRTRPDTASDGGESIVVATVIRPPNKREGAELSFCKINQRWGRSSHTQLDLLVLTCAEGGGIAAFKYEGENQVALRSSLSDDVAMFPFDYVFDGGDAQYRTSLFDSAIVPLVTGCFDGFNSSVLAYGQTGVLPHVHTPAKRF